MSFRRAFLVLLLVAAVLTVPFYYFVYIFSLNQPIHILLVVVAYFVVLGILIRTLPGLKDSTEFIQAMFPGKQGAGKRREVSAASRNDPHNRANVLNAVQNSWIEGFLHQSIDREIRLQLGIKKDAVPRFDMLRRRSGQKDAVIPVEQSIVDVYVASGRKLLILGAPGSGKTITLLQLAEGLIKEARADAGKPLPLIFNLSPWGQHQGPLADWLVEEMLAQYQIGRDLGRAWLEHGQVALLLDGLDEVVAEQRDACVAAINTFVAAYGKLDVVACSRINDYEELQERLNLSNAVLIQALSDAQIRGYLNTQALQHVYIEIKADEKLFDLARAPLLLNVIAVAYADDGVPPEIVAARTEQERVCAIFGRYVARMFAHRPLDDNYSYTQEAACGWLVQLAAGMQRCGVPKFFIENLQPDWLQKSKSHKLFSIFGKLAVGLFGGLVISLYAVLFTDFISSWFILFLGVLFFAGTFYENTLSKLPEILTWGSPFSKEVWRSIKQELIFGLFLGLMSGFFLGVIGWGYFAFDNSPMPCPRNPGIFVCGDMISESDNIWSDDNRHNGLANNLTSSLGRGLVGSILIGTVSGLVFGFLAVLRVVVKPKETAIRKQPNQGIYGALRISVPMLLVVGLCSLVILGLTNILMGFLVGDVRNSFSITFLKAFIVLFTSFLPTTIFSEYGGKTVILHYVLRFLLADEGTLPYPFLDHKLVAYLDAMRDRLLLRRVGGGWVFIHRYLLEYFASLHEPPPGG